MSLTRYSTASLRAALLVTVLSLPATAEDDAACFNAALEGQKLRRAGELSKARQQFHACARLSCPGEVVERCTGWLDEVQVAQPSVVIVTRDADGHDVAIGKLYVDGKLVDGALSGSAIAVDPGRRTFRWLPTDAAPVERRVLIREAEKNRRIELASPRVRRKSAMAPADPVTSSGPPPAAWVLLGVGAVASATFGYVGATALSERSRESCDTGCDSDAHQSVSRKYLIANVALGVAVVALGASAYLFLSNPEPSTGMLQVKGRFQ